MLLFNIDDRLGNRLNCLVKPVDIRNKYIMSIKSR